LVFDRGWRFALGHGSDPAHDFGFGMGQSDFSKTGDFKIAQSGFDDSSWRALDLPHDWAVELPFVRDDQGQGDANSRSHGFKPLGRRYPESSIGWYRRSFDIPESDLDLRLFESEPGQAIVFHDRLLHGGAPGGTLTRVSMEFTMFVKNEHYFESSALT